VQSLRWVIEIAEKQMEVPYQWRSMPEVMAEIPGLPKFLGFEGQDEAGFNRHSRASSMRLAGECLRS
jgi:hypothetical protein